MLAAFLLDDRFASREAAMLRRLFVGIADEGVRVLPFIAHGSRAEDLAEGLADAIILPEAGFLGRETARLETVLQRVADATSKDDERRVVHAFGESMWRLAADAAHRLGALPVYEVWQRSSIARVARVALTQSSSPKPLLCLADPGFEPLIAEAGAAACARTVPWGVHAPPEPPEILRPGLGPTLALFGTGTDAAALRDALTGIAEVIRATPDAMLFVDAEAARSAQLWRVAQRLDLADRLTLIPPVEVDRSLALLVDVLLLPEASGEAHSLILDALAGARAVIAAHDPDLAIRSPAAGVRVLQDPNPESWRQALAEIFARPEETRALARTGWEFIRQQRRASAHVASLLDAYEWATSHDALPFAKP